MQYNSPPDNFQSPVIGKCLLMIGSGKMKWVSSLWIIWVLHTHARKNTFSRIIIIRGFGLRRPHQGALWGTFQAAWGRFGPPLKRYGGAFGGAYPWEKTFFRAWAGGLAAGYSPIYFRYIRQYILDSGGGVPHAFLNLDTSYFLHGIIF